MNGVLFYLNKSVGSPPPGHVIYLKSPWALTSIEQNQFWVQGGHEVSTHYGDGTTKEVLSVIVSEWGEPGEFITKNADSVADPGEIYTEVWEQLKKHRAAWPAGLPADGDRTGEFLDPAIGGFGGAQLTNAEPLLVNEVGSFSKKPKASTAISNLFLASDYVSTFTDLATMEAANEAGRRAVIGILNTDDPGQTIARPPIFPLLEPAVFDPIKAIDDAIFSKSVNTALAASEPAISLVIKDLPLDEFNFMLDTGVLLQSVMALGQKLS